MLIIYSSYQTERPACKSKFRLIYYKLFFLCFTVISNTRNRICG